MSVLIARRRYLGFCMLVFSLMCATASALAHEINQPLGAALNYLYGIDAMRELQPDERLLTIETWGEADKVYARVKDRGPGIAADAREKIFEAFYTTKSGGLGLGLSISRTIVHSHGGKIWVAAEDDGTQGAAIQFMLPRSAS